jgi:integrase/recombinase XerD
MTEQITPLRRRMIEDMSLRNMSPATQCAYVSAVRNFSTFFGRSPDKLTFEDVRAYQLHLVSRGLKPTTINPIPPPASLPRSRRRAGGMARP